MYKSLCLQLGNILQYISGANIFLAGLSVSKDIVPTAYLESPRQLISEAHSNQGACTVYCCGMSVKAEVRNI